MIKFGAPLLLFTTLAFFLWRGLGNDPTLLPSPLLDRQAPLFQLPDLIEPQQVVDNSTFQGRPYVLNVWGSWCPECRTEHPVVSELAKQLPVYGLNWKDEADEAKRWLDQFGNPYQAIPFDPDGRVGIDFGVYGAPETFLIDADGVIRFKHIGPLSRAIVEQQLLPALESSAGEAP